MSIKTFRQFDAEHRRTVAKKYGITLAEIDRLYGPGHYAPEWRAYAIERYEAGDAFTTTQWNKLTENMQRQILRTSRALKMPGNMIDPWKRAA